MKTGVVYALLVAVLFGISTPLAKLLVGAMPPVQLAGLLYAGSGIGLGLVMLGRRTLAGEARSWSLPSGREWFWLAGAVLFGGIIGPVLLLRGLVVTPASTASLLLNLEAVFTALLAWFLFRENFDRRIALGLVAIVAGGVLLSWHPSGAGGASPGTLLVAAACACWALDNNLTRHISGADALVVAALKGIVAGAVNLSLAENLGYSWPTLPVISAAAVLGFVGYGISLTLFVLALRHLGTARAAAYFSVGPFFGAGVALLLHGDVLTYQLVVAALLMAAGVWLHVTEYHVHRHVHVEQTHSHEHWHDEHHQHPHETGWEGQEPHAHSHTHQRLAHAHEHYPDVHHRHEH